MKLSPCCYLPVLALLSVTAAAQPSRPNILWIMSDDHAAEAVGAYGSHLAKLNPTPALDRLAAEGMRFTNAFCTNSICTPSRATLLTGQYSHTNGVRTLSDPLPVAKHDLPRLVKGAGYQTAMIGKWHLHNEPAEFDYYCVLPGQGRYFNPTFHKKGAGVWPKNLVNSPESYDSLHSSDVITNFSIEWLNQRDRSKPFFLMHHFKAPHDNFENAERYDFLYDTVDIPEPASLRDSPNHGSAATQGTGTSVGKRNTRRNMGHHMFVDPALPEAEYLRVSYQRYMKKYLRTVRGLDDNLQRLFDHLRKTGDLDNTIILYTSDQGFMLGQHDYIDKRWMYEPSLRMPFIVRYPARIAAGSITDALVNNTDFAPTLLDLAGVAVPGSMQGRSMRSILETGRTPADWRTATYYRYWMHMTHHDNPAHYGIRTQDFKLIFFYGLPLDATGALKTPTKPGWELYDLRQDPDERRNVFADPAYAATVTRLQAELRKVKQEIGDTDDRYPELLKLLGPGAN
ncbi:MAG: sulfatase [Opitutaceae bacterium]|nr:sulfatase [Opitutaceae bacterium]